MQFIQLQNRNLQRFIVIILVFLNSLPFHQLSPQRVIGIDIWWWNQVFYFLFHSKAGFSTFYIGLLFTRTVERVNILSNSPWWFSAAPTFAHTVHGTLYIAHCTWHTVHDTLYIAHCMWHTVCDTLYIAHCTWHTVHDTLYIAHCTWHTELGMLHIVHDTLYIAHCTWHTYVICCKWYAVNDTL